MVAKEELEDVVKLMRRIGCIQYDGIVIVLTPPYGQKYDDSPPPEQQPEQQPEPPKKVVKTLLQLRNGG